MALYLTIWIGLVLFVSGEVAWRGGDQDRGSLRLARRLHGAGIVLLVVHILMAFATVHEWSHQAAVAATAAQTEAVFGVDWGAGVWANYAFVIVWILDTQWWRARRGPAGVSRTWLWALRAFYLLFVLNAAVIFAVGWRRGLGLAMLGALAWAWRGTRR